MKYPLSVQRLTHTPSIAGGVIRTGSKHLFVVASFLLWLVAESAGATLIAESTFDVGLDGWTGLPSELSWAAAGGNPGGFARWQDASVSSLPLSAPAKFLGDWSALDGVGFLSFDQAIFLSGTLTGRGNRGVSISGPGGIAGWVGPLAPNGCPGQPDCGWTTFVVPLVESDWTVSSGLWSDLLANVTSLQITPELYSNPDSSGLDNVRLATPDQQPIPEPGTFVLLGIGCAGLVFLRRKRARVGCGERSEPHQSGGLHDHRAVGWADEGGPTFSTTTA